MSEFANPKHYEHIGYFLINAENNEGGLWDNAKAPERRPLIKCLRCGALVNGGGRSRENHDQFHAALANLFEDLAEALEKLDG